VIYFQQDRHLLVNRLQLLRLRGELSSWTAIFFSSAAIFACCCRASFNNIGVSSSL
jgi:hypothetical protein